ncbi:M48 family metalloprotease [Nitrogeniibacter mangrovi]|uniref:M48 family metalloprotease n=1 Tax=Nitrogeniibacter mangrovi TaxID=2016596 RepID=A0A6C1B8L5_9RHOO|nr:M48 family metallopeptidase [Nitrogeniibacter mangrovi]QID19175.1 M48 family metalloprotease [Nitrogeniibacter mangrovi]
MDTLYPAGPQDAPASLTQATGRYKRHAWLAVMSLLLFVVLYVALAGWFAWVAGSTLREVAAGADDPLFQGIVGGCAAFLSIFMFKAVFFVKKGGDSEDVEITAQDQPQVFAFLNRLADEAGAPRPHRVFLSARVNAAVFYDLSILNLLFPSRKNLEIGLPLINSLTLSELKAVLAHEFGHFAQRSMAIGTWVYIAQQIAGQVIAKRDILDKFLSGLSRVDIRIAWIGWVLSLIVWSIRSLMDTVFTGVVLAQRALSRQMEFQADLVAVALTGSDELIHALHKLQAADDAWDRTLQFANGMLADKRKPADLFAVQTRIVERMGQILDDPDHGRIPQAATPRAASYRVFRNAFAQPPQMWSTHPANADRERNAKAHYLSAPHDARSAWALFADADAVKARIHDHLMGHAEGETASREETLQRLDEGYARIRYEARYRGAYLGRSLTRHVHEPAELYRDTLSHTDIAEALQALYPHQLSTDLQQLKELKEEKQLLEGLHARVLKTRDKQIRFRGRAIRRRDLPAAIGKVGDEIEKIQARILAHDRRCRAAHLAAAEQIAPAWRRYLIGLIEVQHFAEHSLANLEDAHGLLGNVVAVVTADGKVSRRELKRLLKTANALHAVMADLHASIRGVTLDSTLQAALGTTSLSEAAGDFELPPADKKNINDWMNAIDGWVGALGGPLSALCNACLEQLLHTEQQVAEHSRDGTTPGEAPTPSTVPEHYARLLEGEERKRQTRLGLWDRFQLADGWLPATARLVVAVAIVGGVLGFSHLTTFTSPLSIYNGFNQVMTVEVDGTRIATVAPYSAGHADVSIDEQSRISAHTAGGDLVEQFHPTLSGRRQHYIYNIASGSPLIQWTAVYGNVAERTPSRLGAPRWTTAHADIYFAEPPKSIKSSGQGGMRTVLSGVDAGVTPEQTLGAVATDQTRRDLVRAHLRWDTPGSATATAWRTLAERLDH